MNRVLDVQISLQNILRRGVQAHHFGKNYFELGVGGEGQDTSEHLWVVLSPYEQYCPCEASEQKSKSELKEIKLSYCHSICLLKNKHLERK